MRNSSEALRTLYLGRVADHIRYSGAEIDKALLALISPLGWSHIGLTGMPTIGGDNASSRVVRLPKRSTNASNSSRLSPPPFTSQRRRTTL